MQDVADVRRTLVELADEPARLAAAVQGRHGAEVAEALDALDAGEAARVLAALPLPVAVAAIDSGVLHDVARILERITDRWAGQLLEDISPVRRARIFRVLEAGEARRLRAALSSSARLSLDALLATDIGERGWPAQASREAQEAAARSRRRRRHDRVRRALVLLALAIAAAMVVLGIAASGGVQ
jgi:hypothetical protein